MSTSIVPPGNEDGKQDHRIRSSSGEMSGDSLEGGSRQIKMSPLKNNSSFNIKLCTALERIDLKNTEVRPEITDIIFFVVFYATVQPTEWVTVFLSR